MFLPNPSSRTFVSPFQNNLLRAYMAEFNLEMSRERSFSEYPSRLHAIFLLDSEEEAEKYAKHHPEHVSKRVLKQARTAGSYTFSRHDASWVDFFRRTGIDRRRLP